MMASSGSRKRTAPRGFDDNDAFTSPIKARRFRTAQLYNDTNHCDEPPKRKATNRTKVEDDLRDSRTLPPLLVLPDHTNARPRSQRGRELLLMMKGADVAFTALGELTIRYENPMNGKLFTSPRLLIGEKNGQDMLLYIQSASNNANSILPKISTCKQMNKINGKSAFREAQVKIDANLRTDYHMLDYSYWTFDGAHFDAGLTPDMASKYWKNWLIRVWRHHNPNAPIKAGGTRRKSNLSNPKTLKKGSKRDRMPTDANEYDEFGELCSSGHRQTKADRSKWSNEDAYDNDDVDDEPEQNSEVEDAERELEHKHGIFTSQGFWHAYDTRTLEFDGKDELLLARISQGYSLDADDNEVLEQPPYKVLIDAWEESEDGSVETCQGTLSFLKWKGAMSSGSRNGVKVFKVESLAKQDARNHRRKEQHDGREQKEWADTFRRLLKESSISRDLLQLAFTKTGGWRARYE